MMDIHFHAQYRKASRKLIDTIGHRNSFNFIQDMWLKYAQRNDLLAEQKIIVGSFKMHDIPSYIFCKSYALRVIYFSYCWYLHII